MKNTKTLLEVPNRLDDELLKTLIDVVILEIKRGLRTCFNINKKGE